MVTWAVLIKAGFTGWFKIKCPTREKCNFLTTGGDFLTKISGFKKVRVTNLEQLTTCCEV